MKTWSIYIIGFSDDEECTEHLVDRLTGYASWEEAHEERRKLFAQGGAYEGFDGCSKIVEEFADDCPKDLCVVQDEDGRDITYDVAVELMDDEIRESLHTELAPCSPQEFFNAYCKRHQSKYGERFEVN